MKILKLLALMLLISSSLIAQEGEPCGLYGPGTNGTIMDCDQGPVTYNSSCCNDNPGGWFWTLDGNLDISASTSLPFNFSINSTGGSTVTGRVITATISSLTIDWDCPTVCPPSGHVLVELTACGSEWFNPIIRIGCEQACTPSVQQCYALTCRGCIGVMVNGQPVEIQGTSDGTQLFCYDVGVLGCCTFECGTANPCNDTGTGGGSVGDDRGGVARMTVNNPLESIPEVNVIPMDDLEQMQVNPNLTHGNAVIEVSIPYSAKATQIRLVDMSGRAVLDQQVYELKNQIQLNNLQNGTYVIQLSNSDYTYTKKIVIQN